MAQSFPNRMTNNTGILWMFVMVGVFPIRGLQVPQLPQVRGEGRWVGEGGRCLIGNWLSYKWIHEFHLGAQ